jgi:hypothetical protein
MRCNILARRGVRLLSPAACLAACLSACGTLPANQQTKVTQALAVACNVDGAVVPVAQPVLATLGNGGAAAASLDSLLVHPAVVAACQQLGGKPAGVTPAAAPVPVPDAPPSTG